MPCILFPIDKAYGIPYLWVRYLIFFRYGELKHNFYCLDQEQGVL